MFYSRVAHAELYYKNHVNWRSLTLHRKITVLYSQSLPQPGRLIWFAGYYLVRSDRGKLPWANILIYFSPLGEEELKTRLFIWSLVNNNILPWHDKCVSSLAILMGLYT